MRRLARNILDTLVTTLAAVAVVLAYAFLTRPARPVAGGEIDLKLERVVPYAGLYRADFEHAVKYVSELGQFEIVFDRAELEAARVMFRGSVTLERRNVPMWRLLNQVLSQVEMQRLEWVVEGQRIRISTLNELMPAWRDDTLIRVYDVNDLIDEEVRRQMRLHATGATTRPSTMPPPTRAELEAAAGARLINVLAEDYTGGWNYYPRSVSPTRRAARVWGGKLLAKVDRSAHLRIEESLQLLRLRPGE